MCEDIGSILIDQLMGRYRGCEQPNKQTLLVMMSAWWWCFVNDIRAGSWERLHEHVKMLNSPMLQVFQRNEVPKKSVTLSLTPEIHVTSNLQPLKVVRRQRTMGIVDSSCWSMRDMIDSIRSLDAFNGSICFMFANYGWYSRQWLLTMASGGWIAPNQPNSQPIVQKPKPKPTTQLCLSHLRRHRKIAAPVWPVPCQRQSQQHMATSERPFQPGGHGGFNKVVRVKQLWHRHSVLVGGYNPYEEY